MTGYKNFIDDFPSRCRDILTIARRPALYRDREVTLALMVSSAGFVVPYERLKPDHPSGDSARFSAEAGKLKSLLEQPFTSSILFNKMNSAWYDGKIVSVNGDPIFMGRPTKTQTFLGRTVNTTLKLIRNGLAHGNIFTTGNPIGAIIFIKKNFNDVGVVRDYSFIFVAPQEFLQFLENWFDFLNYCRIPQEMACEVLKDAA